MTDPGIDEYIRSNHDRFTREAITQQLIAAGHDPAAIDQAWTAFAAEQEKSRGPNPWPRFWRAFWLTALVGVVVILVVWLSLYPGNAYGYAPIAAVIFGVTLLVPLLVGAAIVGFSRRRVSATTLAAMALWVPIVLVGLSAGTCIAIGVSGS